MLSNVLNGVTKMMNDSILYRYKVVPPNNFVDGRASFLLHIFRLYIFCSFSLDWLPSHSIRVFCTPLTYNDGKIQNMLRLANNLPATIGYNFSVHRRHTFIHICRKSERDGRNSITATTINHWPRFLAIIDKCSIFMSSRRISVQLP